MLFALTPFSSGRVKSAYTNILLTLTKKILPQDNSFFADGLHPNSLGASIYGEALCTFAAKIGF